MLLNLHALLAQSSANGPGERFVIWFQGCTLGCPNCFNPRTHAADMGEHWSVEQLLERILADSKQIEGITISGGEPFQQPVALLELLRRIKQQSDLSVLIFTGYNLAELEQIQEASEILTLTDILIAGRYVRTLHLGHQLLGSSNQQIHFLSPRYSHQDLLNLPEVELQIDLQGRIVLTGIGESNEWVQ